MKKQTKRTTAISIGSACFATAFIAPSALAPFADTSPMLVTVGLAVPTGLGYAVWQFVNYTATRHDVRIKRQVQPERRRRGESLDDIVDADEREVAQAEADAERDGKFSRLSGGVR